MRTLILAATLAAFAGPAFAGPAFAQTTAPTAPQSGAPVSGGQNNTGADTNVTIPRGSTGADTVQTNSAAGGNANQPSRAVPQGSGGGGSGSAGGN